MKYSAVFGTAMINVGPRPAYKPRTPSARATSVMDRSVDGAASTLPRGKTLEHSFFSSTCSINPLFSTKTPQLGHVAIAPTPRGASAASCMRVLTTSKGVTASAVSAAPPLNVNFFVTTRAYASAADGADDDVGGALGAGFPIDRRVVGSFFRVSPGARASGLTGVDRAAPVADAFIR